LDNVGALSDDTTTVFSIFFELEGRIYHFFMRGKTFFNVLFKFEVDKIKNFFVKEGRPPLRGVLTAFSAGRRGGAPFF
jgi:hypothetical protein